MNGSSLQTSDRTLRRYLLGQLSDEEQSSVEQRFFTDDDYFQQVELAEDDLIEAYDRGELSPAERGRFESHFLSTPERRRRLQLTRTLRGVFGPPTVVPVPSRRWWTIPTTAGMSGWMAAAASLAVAVLLSGYLGLQLSKQSRQFEQQLAARDTRIQQLENEMRTQASKLPPTRLQEPATAPTQSIPQPRTALLSFILTPSLVMRGETTRTSTLLVPSDSTPVELNLEVELEPEQDYASYRVILENPQRAQVWARDGLRPVRRGAARTIVVSLPAGLLQPEQYRVKMFGRRPPDVMEEVDEYVFRVARR
jgi:anti-sigma factor RsiW